MTGTSKIAVTKEELSLAWLKNLVEKLSGKDNYSAFQEALLQQLKFEFPHLEEDAGEVLGNKSSSTQDTFERLAQPWELKKGDCAKGISKKNILQVWNLDEFAFFTKILGIDLQEPALQQGLHPFCLLQDPLVHHAMFRRIKENKDDDSDLLKLLDSSPQVSLCIYAKVAEKACKSLLHFLQKKARPDKDEKVGTSEELMKFLVTAVLHPLVQSLPCNFDGFLPQGNCAPEMFSKSFINI